MTLKTKTVPSVSFWARKVHIPNNYFGWLRGMKKKKLGGIPMGLVFSQFNPKWGCIKLLLNYSFKLSGIRIKYRDLFSLTFNNNSDSCCSAEYSLKSIGTTAISRNSYSLKVLYNLHAKEPIS